ncbi:MAG: hypothetical protein IPG89_17035 [Bacteroidetes bacterium]|nr:hypothetical protein [Bacteroidota bacterium]
MCLRNKISPEGNLEVELVNTFKELDSLKVMRLEHTSYGFFESFPAGVKKTWNTLKFYVEQFKLMLYAQHWRIQTHGWIYFNW